MVFFVNIIGQRTQRQQFFVVAFGLVANFILLPLWLQSAVTMALVGLT